MEKEIIKPNLDLEIEMKVTGLQKLENNMEDVKEKALALQEYYKAIPFIEEGVELDFENEKQMKKIDAKRDEAKVEGTKVNKFKKSIEDKFKEAMEIYNKPIENSLNLKLETIKTLSETYEFLKSQVSTVDSQMLAKKVEQLKTYFKELALKETIDFITYDDMKQNVTLSKSIKSLKTEINNFIAKIKDELGLINSEEFKDEILVEYKKSLNVANAITLVKNRKREIEEMKAREIAKQEALKQQEEAVQKVEKVVEEKKEEILVAPTVVETKEDTIKKIPVTTLTIKNETVERLQAIIKFLEDGGYDYE